MKIRYEGKRRETGDVWSYYFVPVDKVAWQAGQSIRLELPRTTIGVSERRFTIASAPHEGRIQITTRASGSRFKQLLDSLRAGQAINAHNVEGDFVWDPSADRRIFVAGGIGITPFRSMLSEQISIGNPLNTVLLYSSKDSPAVFQENLSSWQAQDPTLSVSYLSKRITTEFITTATDWRLSLIYLSGPSALVETLYSGLLAAGAAPNMLKTDLFTGNLE